MDETGGSEHNGLFTGGRSLSPQSLVQSGLIVRTAGVCGGRARIDGTRIAVWVLESLHRQGADAQEIADIYPQLSAQQIVAALTWAGLHTAEVAADLAAQSEN
jgi:uncharacterized protein (DUF433 family)